MSKLNFVDLFAGCGGLSEGFYKEGYSALAHVEIDHFACETLKTRMKHYGYTNADEAVLEEDITQIQIVEKIKHAIKNQKVDIVIGGPPCQSFSTAGRAKDENGMRDDPRNYLFESYVRILNSLMPKLFVFENVTGLLTARPKGKRIIETIIKQLGENYKVLFDPNLIVFNTVNYGVPQIRKRVILIGVRKDLPFDVREVYESIKKTHYDPDSAVGERSGLKKYTTVEDALFELPAVEPGKGKKEVPFTPTRSNELLRFLCDKNQSFLMDHIARQHNDLDRERYRQMAKNHWNFSELLSNRPDLRHKNARLFNNSYTVQWWDRPSKTILAHLQKDGNLFIHPDYKQARTFTVREAARIQSFPDDFVFCGSRSEQFKQIGNAVPPLFARTIARALKQYLEE